MMERTVMYKRKEILFTFDIIMMKKSIFHICNFSLFAFQKMYSDTKLSTKYEVYLDSLNGKKENKDIITILTFVFKID